MRNIEFRGKDIETGEWKYGYLFQEVDVENKPIKNFIIENTGEVNVLNKGLLQKYYEIDRNTLGQYTGLKDKNGTKIYEGDIVRTSYKEVREYQGVKYDNKMNFIEKVIWSNDYNGWCLEIDNCGFKMYRRLNYCEEINKIKLADCEVIGNIYDNPKLLENNNENK